MAAFHKTTIRVLIWLAVLAVPVGQLPATSCGCGGDASCCETSSFGGCGCSVAEVKQGQCCCARPRTIASKSCCSAERGATAWESSCWQLDDTCPAGCSCGGDCRCGEASSPSPILPPAEPETVERLADSLAANAVLSAMLVELVVIPAQTADTPRSLPLAALACCVTLCRMLL